MKQLFLQQQINGSEFYQELRNRVNSIELADPNKELFKFKELIDNQQEKNPKIVIDWLQNQVGERLPEWNKSNQDFEN